jgi:argininosuccinate lyase
VTGIDLLAVAVRLALGQPPDAWPSQTGVTSAAIQFLLAPRAGRVAEVFGRESVANDPSVVAWEVGPLEGRDIRPPRANEYLGHVITVDRAGLGARALAERALGRLRLRFDDEPPDQQSCEVGWPSRHQIGAAR